VLFWFLEAIPLAYEFPPDVEKLVREHMAAGGYASEDEVLRDALQVLGEFVHSREGIAEEHRQTVAAVREGLADMEAGRMRPLRAIIDEGSDKRSAETE
jgi:Arc/MetJ-type ribon-helix-helix transcriptional regulator